MRHCSWQLEEQPVWVALPRKRPGHKVAGSVSGVKLQRGKGRNERLASRASALQASSYQSRGIPRFTARTTLCGHSQPHAPRQALEAAATHGRSTHEATCYPTVQAARRLRLRGIRGLVHSTAFLKASKLEGSWEIT